MDSNLPLDDVKAKMRESRGPARKKTVLDLRKRLSTCEPVFPDDDPAGATSQQHLERLIDQLSQFITDC